MKWLIETWWRRLGLAALVFILGFLFFMFLSMQGYMNINSMTEKQVVGRFFVIPGVIATFFLMVTTSLVMPSAAVASPTTASTPAEESKPFMAQVVGLQWLNPLQRKDYSTEWQLLWTLGLAKPNKNDDMLKMNPERFGKLQSIGIIADANNGKETFKGFHGQYINELIGRFHDVYYSDSKYFYNAHNRDKTGWRELAGIHVEYALPVNKIDGLEEVDHVRNVIADAFDIGNVHFPTLWSRSTPPDVHVTQGGSNAGFTSLAAGLDYLKTHPTETVWVMNWDAPSFPDDEKIDQNIVLLVLAGPDFVTERDALAWIGYPASRSAEEFQAKKGEPPRAVQAWKAAMETAAHNAGKKTDDIGYVIHDANNRHADSSDRIGNLSHALTAEIPEFDYLKQTFNTPALLGDMGAGTALTDVALAIAYANHVGKNVLVAGTSDLARPTATMVVPPVKVRPIDPNKDWFRARGGDAVFLPWWGLRHDAGPQQQGYSD